MNKAIKFRHTTGVTLALCFLWATPSFSHARLDPAKTLKPRTNSTGEKTAPCGTAGPTTDASKRVVLTAGQDLVVDWQETINHPGYFRIAFSSDGITGFDTNILKNNIADDQNNPIVGTTYHLYSTTVKIPSTPCDNCSIQLIQVMTNTTPPSNYYSCSDIRIVPAGTVINTPSPTPSASASAQPQQTSTPQKPKGLKVTVRAFDPTSATEATDKAGTPNANK